MVSRHLAYRKHQKLSLYRSRCLLPAIKRTLGLLEVGILLEGGIFMLGGSEGELGNATEIIEDGFG